MPKVSGSCMCGQISFEGEGEIVVSANCHCTDCQRATGAAFATLLMMKEADLNIKGTTSTYGHKSARGTDMTKHFCGNCGSPMFGQNSAREGILALRAGVLHEKELIQPKVNVYCDSAIPSTVMDSSLKNFEKMPG